MKFIYTLIVTFAIAVVVLSLSSSYTATAMQLSSPEVQKVNVPPCLQMHYSIEKYADKYDIPKRFAYGIAKQETDYKGPFDWEYRQNLTSYAGAMGPMQIMPSTARMMWPGRKVTTDMLLNDIDFNVETSMKTLRHLYNTYGDWKVAFGAYNTGRPVINNYAIKVYNNK